MTGDDYAPSVGGGLKLKGSKPLGVKKKKSKSKAAPSTSASTTVAKHTSTPPPATESSKATTTADSQPPPTTKAQDEEASLWRQVEEREQDYKTPTEKRHEEMRRKRLEDRLKREGGGRTHKQRVEELNRYLSGLSEHHDMYVSVCCWGGWWGSVANEILLQAENRTGITWRRHGGGRNRVVCLEGSSLGCGLYNGVGEIYGWFERCRTSFFSIGGSKHIAQLEAKHVSAYS